ncbi:anaphase promoting complex subunit 5 [Myotisia sp. PD_48]|nr:anaphase promoting complex subunit 5 [Myotisia sp. PD_48]
MARYLTPSKITLLALISLYSDGVVPNGDIVPILSFVVSCLLPLDNQNSPSNPPLVSSHRRHSSSIDHTSRPEVTQSPSSSFAISPAIKDFENATQKVLSSVPGRTIWDLILARLWRFDCYNTLDRFISTIPEILVKSRRRRIYEQKRGIVEDNSHRILLSRTSPLGAFVRRFHLEYTKLQFHDSVALWKAFVKYRMPTYTVWAKRFQIYTPVDANLVELGVTEMGSTLAQVVYGDLDLDSKEGEGKDMSSKDVERLLEFQVGEMQNKGTRVSPEMRDKLEKLIRSGITVPSLSHYLRFLDSWRAGDYPSSFDHLHRYFDYTIQNRDRTFYQYALLNLAILQADFGCHGEAVSAIQEAIAIARETQDMNCLNFCMSWLYHFGKSFPEELQEIQNTGMLGSEKEALAFLQAKAKETEMWNLLSTSLLSEGKLELLNGGSIASAFEYLVKAFNVTVTKDRCSSMSPLLILQSSIFGRLGKKFYITVIKLLQCYSHISPLEDELRAICRRSQLYSLNGRYTDAVNLMNGVRPEMLQTLKNQQNWSFYMGLLKLRLQLHHDDKAAAEQLLVKLEGFAPSDSEIWLFLSLMRVDLYMRDGNYGEALSRIEQLARSITQENLDVGTQIKLLMLKARIFEKTGQPERGFSLIIRAAGIAHRARVLPCLWEAMGGLSAILMSFREFKAASDILESIVPHVLECESRILAAQTYSYLVDANVGLAGQVRGKQVETQRHMLLVRASGFIDCAYEEYAAMEDVQGQCEMLAKKSMLLYQFEEADLANDFAAKYLDVKRRVTAGRFLAVS